MPGLHRGAGQSAEQEARRPGPACPGHRPSRVSGGGEPTDRPVSLLQSPPSTRPWAPATTRETESRRFLERGAQILCMFIFYFSHTRIKGSRCRCSLGRVCDGMGPGVGIFPAHPCSWTLSCWELFMLGAPRGPNESCPCRDIYQLKRSFTHFV